MQPRKPKLGQNFLTSPAACQRIVEELGNISSAAVVEIGPGKGALTELLASRAGLLLCVELDAALAAALRRRWAETTTVQIIAADILTLDFAVLAKRVGATLPEEAGKLLVIGNLPYYITSDILLHLFAHASSISRAALMVQEEVADRLAASPGVRDYGVLSATAQMHARVEKLFTLPPEAFTPSPSVRSAVVRLTMQPRFAELGVDRERFLHFLQICFRQKRKTLANNLKAGGIEAAQALSAMRSAGVEPAVRAEAVPLTQMARLFRALSED